MAAKPVRLDIDVDDFDVHEMLNRTMSVLTGSNLEAFLRGPAHEHFEDDIVSRFAYEGDRKSGNWPPLSEATIRIREQLGYSGDEANIRSGKMFDVLVNNADFLQGPGYAEMNLPGNTTGEMQRKLETAAKGSTNNPMGFGPTPPRPVLAADESDMAFLLEALNIWIIAQVAGTF